MKIKVAYLTFICNETIECSPVELRGYFAKKFSQYTLLHHHIANKGFLYKYPLVQYKVVRKNSTIVVIKKGVEILQEIYNQVDEITLNNNTFKIIEKIIKVKESEFGITDNSVNYYFLTPYLPLNQQNYEKYQKTENKRQKTDMLEKILIGNILSISKSLDYVVLEKIQIKAKLRQVKAKLKAVPFTGFLGKFETNFLLPNYIGLGKSVSRGFGTIVRQRADIQKTEDRYSEYRQ